MPEQDPTIQIVQQAPKTWKDRGIEWFFSQGTTVVVLMLGVGWLSYVQWKQLPERDAAWAKALEAQAAENRVLIKDLSASFNKELDDRDKRFIEYRGKADERFAKALTDMIAAQEKLLAQKDKDLDRVVNLLTSRINDIQKSTERTSQKVDSMSP